MPINGFGVYHGGQTVVEGYQSGNPWQMALGGVEGATNAFGLAVAGKALAGVAAANQGEKTALGAADELTGTGNGVAGGTKRGSLTGKPEVPPKNADPEMVRSIARQNEAAEDLANAGYDVEQLPNVKKGGPNPDLKIDGVLADVHSPKTSSPISVLLTITDKVKSQAQVVVVNLADSSLSIADMEATLAAKSVEGLEKLFIMKDGKVTRIDIRP